MLCEPVNEYGRNISDEINQNAGGIGRCLQVPRSIRSSVWEPTGRANVDSGGFGKIGWKESYSSFSSYGSSGCKNYKKHTMQMITFYNFLLLCFLQKVRDSLSFESPHEDTITGKELYIAQKREKLNPGSCQSAIE